MAPELFTWIALATPIAGAGEARVDRQRAAVDDHGGRAQRILGAGAVDVHHLALLDVDEVGPAHGAAGRNRQAQGRVVVGEARRGGRAGHGVEAVVAGRRPAETADRDLRADGQAVRAGGRDRDHAAARFRSAHRQGGFEGRVGVGAAVAVVQPERGIVKGEVVAADADDGEAGAVRAEAAVVAVGEATLPSTETPETTIAWPPMTPGAPGVVTVTRPPPDSVSPTGTVATVPPPTVPPPEFTGAAAV